jgi:predicted nucleic acid-binding protein
VILADTSVWVDHLRARDNILVQLLDADQVVMHPFILGELALGNLPQRSLILDTLRLLPQAVTASPAEVLNFIVQHRLVGLGIGYVDVHLLAAAKLTAGAGLWTRDKSLHDVAQRLALAAALPG